MTIDKVELLADRLSSLEKKIDRIEELLLLIVEEDYLTEDERKRISETDDIISNKKFSKLKQIKGASSNSRSMNNSSSTDVENRIDLLIETAKTTGYEEELDTISREIRSPQNAKMKELWDNKEDEVWNNV